MDLVSALRLDADGHAPSVVSFTGGGGKTNAMRRLVRELVMRGVRVVSTSTTRLAAYEVEVASGVVLASGAELPYHEVAQALDRYGQCLLMTPEIVEGGIQKYPGVRPEWVDVLAARGEASGIGAIVVEADGAKMLPLKAPADHEPSLPASTTLLCPIIGMDALGRRIAPSFVHRPERVRAVLGLDAGEDERITPERIARLLLDPKGGRKGLTTKARFAPILNKAETMPARAGARLTAHMLAVQDVGALVASLGAVEGEPVHERWGPVAAVILAAGGGRRFGGPKQLARVETEPLAVRAVRTAFDAGVTSVVVITGAYADEVSAVLAERFGPLPGLDIVHNPAWEQGQSTSLHAALRWLPNRVEGALFLPVDQPYLEAASLRRLLRCWRLGSDLAAPFVDGEVRGAPALFDRRYWAELLAVRGDVGGREVLLRHANAVAPVAVVAAQLRDIDTPGDLADAVRG